MSFRSWSSGHRYPLEAGMTAALELKIVLEKGAVRAGEYE